MLKSFILMDLLDIFNGFLRRFRDDLPVKTIFSLNELKNRNMPAIRFRSKASILAKKVTFFPRFRKKEPFE